MSREARNPGRSPDPRGERAQVMVETAIALPLQLIITLAVMQYCLIAAGKQVVNVAAHAACRALLVGENPHRAASIVCSPIAGSYRPPGTGNPIFVPGRGNLRHSAQSQVKTEVRVLNGLDDLDQRATVEVIHHFQLIVPFVEWTPFIDWHVLWGDIERLGPRRVVHKVITQTMTLPQPWDGDLNGVDGHPIIPDLGDVRYYDDGS